MSIDSLLLAFEWKYDTFSPGRLLQLLIHLCCALIPAHRMTCRLLRPRPRHSCLGGRAQPRVPWTRRLPHWAGAPHRHQVSGLLWPRPVTSMTPAGDLCDLMSAGGGRRKPATACRSDRSDRRVYLTGGRDWVMKCFNDQHQLVIRFDGTTMH